MRNMTILRTGLANPSVKTSKVLKENPTVQKLVNAVVHAKIDCVYYRDDKNSNLLGKQVHMCELMTDSTLHFFEDWCARHFDDATARDNLEQHFNEYVQLWHKKAIELLGGLAQSVTDINLKLGKKDYPTKSGKFEMLYPVVFGK